MTSPNIWAPGVAISANNSLKSQTFVAVEGQTAFTLTAFLYAVNTGSLQVFVGGLHQRAGVDFTESAPNSFTLTTGVSAGTIVTCVAAVEVSGTVDLAGAMAALEAHAVNTSVHGVGTVVGETEAQTLSNKTLEDPTVTDGTFIGPSMTDASISGGVFTAPAIQGGTADSIGISESVFSGTVTSLDSPLAVADGGTGATTQSQARTNLDVPSRSGSGASGDWNIRAAGLSSGPGTAPSYATRAWVVFSGATSPPTINASGNVASMVKNGTGDYTINFTTAMPDANYAVLLGLVDLGVGNVASKHISYNDKTTTSVRIYCSSFTGSTNSLSRTDFNDCSVAIMR